MKKIFFVISLILLQSCYKYKETNPLAIPQIASEELKAKGIKK